MGYILPIPQYQYQDYQQRVLPKRNSPLYLEKVYPVTLRNENPTQRNKHPYSSPSLHIPQNFHCRLRNCEKVYAEITGKGHHFSETI